MPNRRLRFLPLAILLLLAVFMILALRHQPSNDNGRLVGEKMIPFNMPSIDGKTTFSPSLWQGEVAMLNVFASWCLPCTAEHPLLMQLADKKIAIYGLAWRDHANKVDALLRSHGNPYRAIGLDSDGRTTLALALTGVPETFVIDKHGIIRYHLVGALSDDVADQIILPLLKRLEDEK